MIIDHDRKFLFIAVAKTACTSIHRRFEIYEDPKPEIYHISLGDALKEYPLAKDYFKFGFVRNPYDRLVSAFYNFRFSAEHKDWAYPIYEFDTFREFVLRLPTSECRHFIHLRPQTEYLCINGRVEVDFVGKYENLDLDFREVEKKLAIEHRLLSKERVSRHPPAEKLYDDETKEIVWSIYQDDFKEFGYTK